MGLQWALATTFIGANPMGHYIAALALKSKGRQ